MNVIEQALDALFIREDFQDEYGEDHTLWEGKTYYSAIQRATEISPVFKVLLQYHDHVTGVITDLANDKVDCEFKWSSRWLQVPSAIRDEIVMKNIKNG